MVEEWPHSGHSRVYRNHGTKTADPAMFNATNIEEPGVMMRDRQDSVVFLFPQRSLMENPVSLVSERSRPNPTLKFAPSGRWDAPSARPLAAR